MKCPIKGSRAFLCYVWGNVVMMSRQFLPLSDFVIILFHDSALGIVLLRSCKGCFITKDSAGRVTTALVIVA